MSILASVLLPNCGTLDRSYGALQTVYIDKT